MRNLIIVDVGACNDLEIKCVHVRWYRWTLWDEGMNVHDNSKLFVHSPTKSDNTQPHTKLVQNVADNKAWTSNMLFANVCEHLSIPFNLIANAYDERWKFEYAHVSFVFIKNIDMHVHTNWAYYVWVGCMNWSSTLPMNWTNYVNVTVFAIQTQLRKVV